MSDSRSCVSCGQPIPPTAKLAARVVNRGQLAALCGERQPPSPDEQVHVDMCLQCQLRLSRLEVD